MYFCLLCCCCSGCNGGLGAATGGGGENSLFSWERSPVSLLNSVVELGEYCDGCGGCGATVDGDEVDDGELVLSITYSFCCCCEGGAGAAIAGGGIKTSVSMGNSSKSFFSANVGDPGGEGALQ